MATWGDLEREAPDIATEARRLLDDRGAGRVLLATVRGQMAPRIHPISVAVVDGILYGFIGRSAKRTDLEIDRRYAMHALLDVSAPDELAIRGEAHAVTDAETRHRIADVWTFEPDESYGLFAFDVESVIVANRTADEWPPRYRRWPPPRAGRVEP